jgi:glycosyltransferase involved in cell wall biosynthesis
MKVMHVNCDQKQLRLKIALFQSDMAIGGIRRSLLALLDYLQDKSADIDLYLYRELSAAQLELPPNVTVHMQKRLPPLLRHLPFSLLFRIIPGLSADKTYDLAIDYNGYWNECALGALTVPAKKRILWIHSDYKRRIRHNRRFRLLWLLTHAKIIHYDRFVAVSTVAAESFAALSGTDPDLIDAIPNRIKTDQILTASREPVDFQVDPAKYNLSSMGSLIYSKGFDLLVSHMQRIVRERPGIHLYIIGEGPYRKRLERQIRDLALTDWITLLGQKSNPFPFLAQMDGFVLTSRYEGQCLAILEALSLGLTIFIPRHLEANIKEVHGQDDIEQAIIRAMKTRQIHSLDAYNQSVEKKIDRMLGLLF